VTSSDAQPSHERREAYPLDVSYSDAIDSYRPPSPIFVGRSSEIASLSRCVELSLAGKAQTVWIEGEAGCGKTGLVNWWLDHLSDEFRVFRAEADELATELSLEVVGQLGRFDATDGFGVGMEILDLVDSAQNDGPVVVVVEDLHWADLASRQALLTAARRLRNDRSLVLVTSRPVLRDDGWDRFTFDGERCVRINLGPLTVGEVGELARACGTPLNHRSTERLHQHTLGHALYIRTLLAELTNGELTSSEGGLPAPRSLAWTTVGRMSDTPKSAQMLGAAMAIVNKRLPLVVVANIANVDEPALALDALLDTGFVRWFPDEFGTPLEYVHPLYRAAIYDDLSPSTRQELHLAAAGILGADDALLHRVAASDPCDQELFDDLVANATGAESKAELASAAKYWLWASSLAEGRDQDEAERALLQGVRLLLADAQFHRAEAFQAQVESTNPSSLTSLLLGRIAWEAGDAIRAEEWFNEALSLAGGEPQSVLRLEALVRLAALLVIEHRGHEAWEAATQALELGSADPTMEVRAWAELARAEGQIRGAAAGLALLNDRLTGEGATIRQSEVDLLLTRGILGFYAGRNVQATADFRNVIRLVRQGAKTGELPRAHLQLAQLLIIGGEWDEAILHARLGLSLVDDGGQVWVEAQAHAAMASVMGSRGEWAPAVAHAASARAIADIVGTIEAVFTAHIAESALARAKGDATGVIASLGPLVGTGNSETMSMLTSLGWWPVLIHAHLDVGDVELAQHQLDQIRVAAADRMIDLDARSMGLQARVSLATGKPDQAAAEFAQSLELFGADDALLDRAAVHHHFGCLLHARGKRQLAVDQFRKAHDLYRGAGAQPYLDRVEADLEASGISAGTPSASSALSLTEREQDVVALVTRGMTNREVAAELYVSSKAVEYHLRNVYGKLGVTSRSELRERLSN
jgi:ATP/maltotriose-dependent transcriptional regulator MalT